MFLFFFFLYIIYKNKCFGLEIFAMTYYGLRLFLHFRTSYGIVSGVSKEKECTKNENLQKKRAGMT